MLNVQAVDGVWQVRLLSCSFACNALLKLFSHCLIPQLIFRRWLPVLEVAISDFLKVSLVSFSKKKTGH